MNKYLTGMYSVYFQVLQSNNPRLDMDSCRAQILLGKEDNTVKYIKQTPGMICIFGGVTN